MPSPHRTTTLRSSLLFLTGIILAITTSVFASSLGTNLSVTGNLTVNSTSATSTFAAPISASSGNQIISSAGTTNNLLLNPYGGNVGVGTTSPTQLLSVSSFGSNSNSAYFAGRVGIGTNNPGALLHAAAAVAGNAEPLVLENSDGAANDSASLSFRSGGATSARLAGIRTNTTTNDGALTFSVRDNANGAPERMRVTSLGNLGIGTTTPAWLLQVNDTRPSFALSDSSAGANLKHWLFTSEGGNLYIGTTTDLYATSTVPAFSLLNGGKVGIGTTSPSSQLSVQSATNATSTLHLGTGNSATNGSCVQMYSPNGTAYALYVANGGTLTTAAGACQ